MLFQMPLRQQQKFQLVAAILIGHWFSWIVTKVSGQRIFSEIEKYPLALP